MLASFGSLSVVPWILFAQASSMMDYVPSMTATQPQETRTMRTVAWGKCM